MNHNIIFESFQAIQPLYPAFAISISLFLLELFARFSIVVLF